METGLKWDSIEVMLNNYQCHGEVHLQYAMESKHIIFDFFRRVHEGLRDTRNPKLSRGKRSYVMAKTRGVLRGVLDNSYNRITGEEYESL